MKNTKDINTFYHLIFLLVWTLIFMAGVAAMIVSPQMEQLLEYPLTVLMFVVLGSLFGKYRQVFGDNKPT